MTTHVVESEGYGLARKMDNGEDDPISVGTDNGTEFLVTYKWGPPEGDYLLQSLLEREVNQQEFMGQGYPDATAGNYPADSVVVQPFRLINGLPFKMVYGRDERTTTLEYIADETRIIYPIDPSDMARKQRFNLWEQLGSFDYEVFGTIMNNVNVNIQRGGKITAAMSGVGAKNSGTAFTQDPVTPIYPKDAAGNQVKQPYSYTETLMWNYQDIDKWTSINVMGKQNIEGMMGSSGYYEHLDEQFPIATGIVIFAADVPDALWTDYWAGTPYTAFLRITKGNQDTIQLASETIADVTAKAVTMVTGATSGDFDDMYLKMTDGSFKNKWYRIASNTTATPTVLTLYDTPDDIDGDNAYITDDVTKFIEWQMDNAVIATIDSTKTKYGKIVFAITIVGTNCKMRIKDNVIDAAYDEPSE